MLEAFERHLKQHNIAKQFEQANTKEDKIAVCKKFLEDEGYSVKSSLDAEKQYQEAERYGMVANPFVFGSGGAGGGGGAGGAGGGGGGYADMGKITIGDMGYDSMTLAIDPSVMNSITVSSMDTFQPTKNQPTYISAKCRVSDNIIESFSDIDHTHLESYVVNELVKPLEKELKNYIINNNLIKSETDYSTNDKLFAVKIGIVE